MTQTRKPRALKPIKAVTRKPATTTKAAPLPVKKAAKPAVGITPEKAIDKPKRIRGDFTMPDADYALITTLKARSKHQGRPVKKNELLRAGLRALNAMDGAGLKAAIAALGPAKAAKRSQ